MLGQYHFKNVSVTVRIGIVIVRANHFAKNCFKSKEEINVCVVFNIFGA